MPTFSEELDRFQQIAAVEGYMLGLLAAIKLLSDAPRRPLAGGVSEKTITNLSRDLVRLSSEARTLQQIPGSKDRAKAPAP